MPARAATVVVALGVALLVATSGAAAGAKALPPVPKILAVAGASNVGAHGGTDTVRVSVQRAATCRLALKSDPFVRVSFGKAATNCAEGTWISKLRFGANPIPLREKVRFLIIATLGRSSVTKTFLVTVEKLTRAVVPATTTSTTTTTTTTTSTTTTTTTIPPTTTTTTTPPQFAQSSNWAGYILRTTSLATDVHGAWTVPALNCAQTPNSATSTWVGVGGVSSSYLLQTGVIDSCVNGIQQNVGFWELYPTINADDFASFPVHPGDAITASVTDVNGTWGAVVSDANTGLSGFAFLGLSWGTYETATDAILTQQGSTTYLLFLGGFSAEWIQEDFFQGGGLVQLADFGTVQFSSMTTNVSDWFLTTADCDEMVQSGTVLAVPTDPSTGQYEVTWQAA